MSTIVPLTSAWQLPVHQLVIRSNVPQKAEKLMHQEHHSLDFNAKTLRIVYCIAYIASSKVIICSFTRLMWVRLEYFEHVLLKSLGLQIQLSHLNSICSLLQPAFNDDFIVIHADGIHEVAIDYCGWQYSIPKTIQLLWARLFPTTVINPKTVATFQMLNTNTFQILSFTSKVSDEHWAAKH